MITFNRTDAKGKWYDFDDDSQVKFKIKPFKNSVISIRPDANIANLTYQASDNCLIDWKGIVDQNGNEIEFSDDNKNFLLDHSLRICNFIYSKACSLSAEIVKMPEKKT